MSNEIATSSSKLTLEFGAKIESDFLAHRDVPEKTFKHFRKRSNSVRTSK